MDAFLITNSTTDEPGVPVHLDAMLHEAFDPKGADKPMSYDWVCRASAAPDRGAPLDFPDELWLISKDHPLRFDCHLAFEGMLASTRFLDLIDERERANFKVAKVHAVDKKGKEISLHPLHYVKFVHNLAAVDLGRTRFIQSRAAGKAVVTRDGRPGIGLVETLAFDEAKTQGMNLFVSQDLKVNDTFVSRAVFERYQAEGMLGLEFTEVANYRKAEQFKVRDLERVYGQKLDEIEVIGGS